MAGVEDWFMLFAGIVMILAFVSTLAFGRMTVAPIEKKIKQDGHSLPCPWYGPGARLIWYAYAIAIPVGRLNRADNPLINVAMVRNYASNADRIRAIAMVVSCYGTIVVTILFWVLGIDSS